MVRVAEQTRRIWRRAASLGWPIAVQQFFNTLMRTVDIFVTGLFSPAAIAAVGIADLYAQFPLRVGLSFGTGAIALSSQDTGRGATVSRNRVISQALVLGFLCGVPLVVVGYLFSRPLIGVLGADAEVVRTGGRYLFILFAAAPMRIVGLVGIRSLQGTGDTQTPMVLNSAASVLNILLTLTLGLGLWIAPALGVVGVGIATFTSRTAEAVSVVGVLASARNDISLVWSRDATIARQLIAVSLPNFAEGMSTSLARFPFNAILLAFGTAPNAAYHVGRRIYQQLAAPFSRALTTVASIIVGQTLGEGEPTRARREARAILSLSLVVLGAVAAVLFVGARRLVYLFEQDPEVVGYAVSFTRVFAVSVVFMAVFYPLSGALRGAGDTRTPFYARFLGSTVFLLGVSFALSIVAGYEVIGAYLGLGLSFACWAGVVAAGFVRGNWAGKAAAMIEERSDVDSP